MRICIVETQTVIFRLTGLPDSHIQVAILDPGAVKILREYSLELMQRFCLEDCLDNLTSLLLIKSLSSEIK